MSASTGSRDEFSEGMVVVRVADQINQALTGRPGRSYESPAQPREQALRLVQMMLGYTAAELDGKQHWSCPIAGGRRTVVLKPATEIKPPGGLP